MTLKQFLKILSSLPKPAQRDNWVKVFDEMAVHTRKRLPKELLLKRRPNEEENIYDFRLENYEPITYGSMNKALDRLNNIFNDLTFSFTGSDTLKKYVSELKFGEDGHTLRVYLQKEVLKRDIEDPNGLLVWMPSGKGVTDSSEKVEPIPMLIESGKIRYMDDEILIFVRDEYPELMVEGEVVDVKEAYWMVTKQEVNEVFKYEKGKSTKWIGTQFYAHKIGKLPMIVLGGDKNADGYLESYFGPYNAFGNEAIRQFSDWQAIMLTSAYPFIEELATDCEEPGCVGGLSRDGESKCKKCGGLGKIIPRTPYGIYVRNLPTGLDDDKMAQTLSIPSRRYISPDIAIVKHSSDMWELLVEKAEDALNLVFTKEAQSGIAKDYDRENLYAMLAKIGNNFFDNILYKSLWFIEAYLIPGTEPQINVIKPKVYRVMTEAELMEEIGRLKEKNAPAVFILEATRELAKKRFAGNPAIEKMFDVMVRLDPLMPYTVDEKETMYAANLITKEAIVRSTYLYPIMIGLIEEMTADEFLKADFKTIRDKVEKMAKELIPPDAKPIIENPVPVPGAPQPAAQ